MKDLSPGRWHLLLAVVVAAWFASFAVYPDLYRFVGVLHYGAWFLDSFAILASNDALGRGLDPWQPNPLDYFNRPHVYTHWWLGLHDLGLTRAHNLWLGLSWVGAFLVAALATLRPRGWREALWYLAVLGSSPVLLGVNRANNDLAIFALLAPVVPCLLDGRRPVRLLAVGLIALAAGLKFFPACAGLVLLTGAGVTTREVRERLVLAVLALGLVAADLAHDLAGIGQLTPKAHGLMTFGAANLPASFGLSPAQATLFGLLVAVVVIALYWRSRWFEGWVIGPGETAVWLTFVLGGVLLAGCFFSGVNFGYRWVFAVWLAPLLWRLPRDPAAPKRVRRLAGVTAGLLVISLWADALVSAGLSALGDRLPPATGARIANGFFALEQPVTWAFFVCLLAFLTHFAREGVRGLLTKEPTKAEPAR